MDAESRKRLELVARCMDLTSLEDDDTAEKIRALCARALEPGGGLAPVAAVCVLPGLVREARQQLEGTGVLVVAATGAFPSGRLPVAERVAEIRDALDAGADEVDTVLDHHGLLIGDELAVRRELEASREACGDHTMKVILETGVLESEPAVRRAARVAMESGADFIKTSTGKIAVGATPDAARWMAEAIQGHARVTGRRVGLKMAGGVRGAGQALGFLAIVEGLLGPEWTTPARFRIGASTLLDAVVAALSAD